MTATDERGFAYGNVKLDCSAGQYKVGASCSKLLIISFQFFRNDGLFEMFGCYSYAVTIVLVTNIY